MRSYKGILPSEIKKDGIQIEIPIKEKYSIISAIVPSSKNNIEYILNQFSESNSFIINTSDSDFLSEDTILYIVQHCMIHKGASFLNYIKLIDRFCTDGAFLYRIGGDGGDRYVSLQIFFLKEQLDMILGRIVEVIGESSKS